MKHLIADALKRVARKLTALACRIDGPKITVYGRDWQRIGDLPRDVSVTEAVLHG